MITIYTMAFNEEVFLQYMINHYKERFPSCKFVVYDNYSTDRTSEIAKNNGCEVRLFDSNNQIDDVLLRDLKNSCWKDAETDWVLVCDVDELLDITEADLKKEEALGFTIIKSEGWHMITMKDELDIENIKYGSRLTQYDKAYLFNKKYIQEINYVCGCHTHNAQGLVKLSDNAYRLYHYKAIGVDYFISRNALTAERLSERNKKYGMGLYNITTEEEVRQAFIKGRVVAVKVRD
jgi:glycosyltransferase involved in cell wall biosynthesis